MKIKQLKVNKIVLLLILSLIQVQICAGKSEKYKDGAYIHDTLYQTCSLVERDSVAMVCLYGYFNNAVFGSSDSNESASYQVSSEIFKRQSFIDFGMIIMDNRFWDFCLDNGDLYNYLMDYRIEYLYQCTNDSIVYLIIDNLLRNNNDNGLIAKWNNCDFSLLPAFEQFLNCALADGNIYRITELYIIAHNSGNKEIMDRLRRRIKKIECNYEEVLHLLDIIDVAPTIDYSDFLSWPLEIE